jgi:hypothetical protein
MFGFMWVAEQKVEETNKGRTPQACSLTKPPVCRNSEGHGSTARYTPSALIDYRDIQRKIVNPNLVQDLVIKSSMSLFVAEQSAPLICLVSD